MRRHDVGQRFTLLFNISLLPITGRKHFAARLLHVLGIEMNFNQIKQRTENELVVVIDEEWGYRAFLWFPGMTGAELEAWWTQLEDVDTFWRPEPGTRLRLRRGWPGEFIDAEESSELSDLWSALLKVSPYWSHIDMNYQTDLKNPDTFLKRRDGTVFLHRGASIQSTK